MTTNFKNRLLNMIKYDFKRLIISNYFYIFLAGCLLIPILIIVMTSMMEGTAMTDKNGNVILDEFNNPVLMEGFKNVYQMLGTTNNSEAMAMDITSMCNINMVYFAIAIFGCIHICLEFKSGYIKNIFTVYNSKLEYIISKTLTLFLCGAMMILLFFIGSLLGGLIVNLSFELNDLSILNIIMCVLSKIGITFIFVSISIIASIISKDKLWLSIILSLVISMFLFMSISIISPLSSTIINVAISFIGGLLLSSFTIFISNLIFKKINLI